MSSAAAGEDTGGDQPGTVPGTKAARHVLIAQILSRSWIRSQAELRDALAARGVSATQATLSRDLVELRATKVRSATGVPVYSLPEVGAPGQVAAVGSRSSDSESLSDYVTARLTRWCADLLVAAEFSGSQVVLRTPAGAAQLLAGAVDDAMMPGVLGCIAGDDTVLVITRSEQDSAELVALLLALAEPASRR
ncbi:ArgR family transcriptional regulator [Actinomyces sp. 2119]|uniref:Arginine repressor n=1 Tax=Actinomyces lilanjuaniae TaxID=2321394 RepID=A0ABM6Z3X1_9ACTO|nr:MULTISPECIES: ArgR family transcriptional regulator [Actinomyces]AYD89627.1 ArgR family transcriptional regulator [Actinomyces lilanjuaniae]RJF40217.1 ArgR family transcriptional regulator [Actinomyces sp. 2119]